MRGTDVNQELYLVQQLQRHEGTGPVKNGRLMPYRDSVGKMSIGFGRNLDDKGISRNEANMLLANDIEEHVLLLEKYLPWSSQLDWPRRFVLISMAFNLGVGPSAEQPHGKLLQFIKTLMFIRTGRYADAADSMLQSRWADQVGPRAQELAKIMRTGVLS